MTRIFLNLVALGLWVGTSTFAAEEKKADKKADDKPPGELVATWKLDPESNADARGDKDAPNQVTVVFEADTWKLSVINEGGTQELSGGYFADTTMTPKTLDVSIRGDTTTTEIYAIYEIVGDKLTIAWRQDGTRPADFNGTKEEGAIKIGFIRETND
jgi:uncharacterized protein (TIGR03067 family)